MMRLRPAIATIVVAASIVAGCGGSDRADDQGDQPGGRTFEQAVQEAQSVDPGRFPKPDGRSLQQIARRLSAIDAGLATSNFTPGKNRLAFGLLDDAKKFVYGKTVVYLARRPDSRKVIGPIAAPADPLLTKPPFRSKGAALATDDIAAIYETQVSTPTPGRWFVLALTRLGGRTYGASTQIEVKRRDSVPAPGEPAPTPATETVQSAGGDLAAIDTRDPHDDMHDVDLEDAAGKRPVALIFATPQLCQTRVCGPVVDIAQQMKAKYGDQMDFVHQEVYVDNEVQKGLRPPLQAFGLATEPWLFTIDREGRVAERVEGSFGTVAFERAIKAAL